MTTEFTERDKWTSEQVAQFKEKARVKKIATTQQKAFQLDATAHQDVIVAEGDSWFFYLPGTDVIDCLESDYSYSINSYAKAGDTLENMIYGTNINRQFERISPSINIVLSALGEIKPKIFLFSGGGNDIAGDEFESYLNHKDSGLPGVRVGFMIEMINVVFRKYFVDLIAKVAAVSPNTHIVVHGYGHTAPTGESVDFLGFTFAGPWLRPALARKGIFDHVEQRKAVFTLIDKYNEMLGDLAHTHNKFHHVDLRDMLDPDKDWVNELHLRNSAYARVATRIHDAIKAI
ncbi:MAG: SGNH/GDSL hydrolase family protein [Thermodesulfovibrionia bacterium]|nr:SGNH/GDSL hydrolase family protein [Thermodesulfovibrionia bacterium]